MSVNVMARVFYTQFENIQYPDKQGKIVKVGKQAAKGVMLAIADSADDWGENSWQSFETIAEKSSIERRSVMRVIRGLMLAKYLSIAGVSRYGTNDYKINLAVLGNVPAKRAKNGRPQTTGDSSAETGDPSAETGDPESPDPSITHPNPPSAEPAKTEKRGDFVDLAIDLLGMPGLKKAQRFEGYESVIKVKTGIEPTRKKWQDFFEYVDKQPNQGKDLQVFLEWLVLTPNFDASFWGPERMRENFGRAFVQETAPVYDRQPAAPVIDESRCIPNPFKRPAILDAR